MKRRVAVTGMGVVSPIGGTLAAFEEALFAGVSGVGPVTVFDASALPTRIAAEVKLPVPDRDRKRTFARLAAAEATAMARPGEGGGLSFGLGLELFEMGDLLAMRSPGFTLPRDPAARLTFLQTPADLCVRELCAAHGLTAPPLVHVSACAAGADAVGAGYRLVASGRRAVVLAGGADSMVNPLGMGGFCALRAMSTRNDEPARASRPFDKRRDGFVLGEGAGVLVLEDLAAAQARGATVLAEIVGYGNSFDAHGISEPHPEGEGALVAMQRALADAGIGPEAVGAVNAHGTSTRKNDPVEALALRRLLGPRAREVPVCATKSMIGHLVAAAGAVEAIAAILCLQRQRLHPTLNLDEPDPACDLRLSRGEAHAHEVALSTSFGFGGQNACLVLRRA